MQVQLKRNPQIRLLYQFSFDGKHYYNINDRNIIRVPPYEPLREKLNRVLGGATEIFEGYYCRETKALAIIAN